LNKKKLKYTPTTCAVQCEEILENLEQMNIELDGGMASYPDLISYHFVMDAWAKSCHADSGAKAEDILNKLTFLSNKKRADLRPSTTTYNIVLDAHSNSGKSAHECEAVLQCMHAQYEAGNNEVRPNVMSYSIAIDACGKSKSVKKHGWRCHVFHISPICQKVFFRH